MLLADFGADVVRIDKSGPTPSLDVLCRRKRSLQIDLKDPSSKAVLEKLLAKADVLIDPFRPGVLESLDLDPGRLIGVNEKLIVAQLTGFRKDGSILTRKNLILGNYKDMAGMNDHNAF
jgi:alpha-methylacyl-CoA racemase